MKNALLAACLFPLAASLSGPTWAEDTASASSKELRTASTSSSVEGRFKDGLAFVYQRNKPAGSACVSPSACYFHPLATPSGIVITDVAPDDHLHHRGLFFAWLVVRNADTAGDFWGWGKDAPLEDRLIVNRDVSDLAAEEETIRFTAHNDWTAGKEPSTVLLQETLTASVSQSSEARVYDLAYRFDAPADVTLGQQAFSGFALRTRKDAPITVHDPAGPVTLAPPSHLDPKSDWPDRPWYAFELALPEGKKAGAAVLNHPGNPPTLWHNVAAIGLLNPCIVAPSDVAIPAGKPLILRYRVILFDGAVPAALLNQEAETFAKTSPTPKK